ncbi:MAG: hypothetical protein Q8Q31_01080 [Nanoarchaeota archaeon]|nr:hypothetical protein [Nanoarchaeota archaeon]
MSQYIIDNRVKLLAKGTFSFIIFLFIIMPSNAADVSIFEVDVLGDQVDDPVISLEVQDRVDFGEVENGRQTSNVRINVTNTGNVGIIVTPKLTDSSEDIFNYTYFQRRTTEPYSKIGIFNFNISAPAKLGENKSDYIYAKMDLRNYPSTILRDLNGHTTNVKFFAVSQ